MNFRPLLLPIVALAFVMSANAAFAATAGVSGPAQVQVGRTFQVSLSIGAADAVDTARFVGTYPADLLELQGMANGGALPNRSPGSSFGNGSFNFGAFSLGAPVNGGATAGTLTFRAKAVGEAVISLGSGTRILSAGEDQLTGRGSVRIRIVEAPAPGEITVTPPAEASIEVASTSHPDEDAWYPSRNLSMTWDISGRTSQSVFFGFDQSPEGPAEMRATSSQATFVAPSDGVWYGHLVIRFSPSEIVRRDFRFQVDTAPPRAFAVVVDHAEVISAIPNTLRFAALDDASGVAYYEVWIDDRFVTSTSDTALVLGRMDPGEYRVRVVATDHAGNATEARTTFRILAEVTQGTPPIGEDEFREAATRWLFIGVLSALLFVLGYWCGAMWKKRRASKKSKKKS